MRKEELKARLLFVLSQHVGASKAIEQSTLYREVFGKSCRNKHNEARELRKLIESLRREGVPILASTDKDGGGYYLASAGQELENYCRRLRKRALKILSMEAKLRKISLPELIGQLSMALPTKTEGGSK